MLSRRRLAGWTLLATIGLARASAAAQGTPSDSGLYTSAIFESEAAMLKGRSGKHGCMWKGRKKGEGKLICRSGLQLKCGRNGWFKSGPC